MTTYDYRAKKVVAVLSNRLEIGVALNVLAHLSVAIGRYAEPDLMGRPQLVDASGVVHCGISKYPVIITQVKPSTVRKAIEQARQAPIITLAAFPKQMLDTGHDDELAVALSTVAEPSIEYLGAILYGPAEDINAITGKYSLWR